MAAEEEPRSAALPETLGWYRDAANWIVGISTGAVAGVLAIRESLTEADPPAQMAAGVSAIAFVFAIVAGIQFYLWIVTFANQRERRNRLHADVARAADDKKGEVADAMAREERAERRFGYWYVALLWSFHVGTVAAVAAAVLYLAQPPQADEAWSISQVSRCRKLDCRQQVPATLRIETRSGRSWLLDLDTAGVSRWVPVDTLVP